MDRANRVLRIPGPQVTLTRMHCEPRLPGPHQIKLKNLVLDAFVPPEALEAMMVMCTWNDHEQAYVIAHGERAGNVLRAAAREEAPADVTGRGAPSRAVRRAPPPCGMLRTDVGASLRGRRCSWLRAASGCAPWLAARRGWLCAAGLPGGAPGSPLPWLQPPSAPPFPTRFAPAASPQGRGGAHATVPRAV